MSIAHQAGAGQATQQVDNAILPEFVDYPQHLHALERNCS
jgi:hypothetical protein